MRSAIRGRRSASLALLSVVVGVVVAACGSSSNTTSTTSTTAGNNSVAQNWSLPNADPWDNRTVASKIDSSDVSKLKVAWTIPITGVKGLYGVFASTPVVSNGIVYLQDLSDSVYAVNESNGQVEWKYKVPSNDTSGEGPNGVAVVNGVVYGETETAAFALQATTGEVLWKTPNLATKQGQGFNIAPMITGGVEYLSTSGQKQGGVAYALNAATGKVIWQFQETNKAAERALGGNLGTGGAWGTPLVVGNSVYLGIANPYRSINDALHKSTQLLYNDSTVSLNAKTGKLQWYYQAVPNDFHDWDMQIGPMYAPNGPGGQPTVIDAGKMGFVYAYNAKTGKLLWKTSVGHHNGHDNDGALALKGQWKKPKLPYTYCPGALGGVETQMATADGVVYVPINNLCSTFTGYNQPIASLKGVASATGGMAAIDLKTGKILWNDNLPSSAYGAATVTNDLVFTTTFDGKILAFDRKTGKQVWSEKLSASTNSPLAIDGSMLVTAASYAAGAGQKAEIVAYSLNGPSSSTSTTSGTSTSTGTSTSSSATPVSLSSSQKSALKIVSSTCGACHTMAEAGVHGAVGPNLDQLKPSESDTARQVIHGGGGMPAFGKTYSNAQITAIAQLVSKYAGTGKNLTGQTAAKTPTTPRPSTSTSTSPKSTPKGGSATMASAVKIFTSTCGACHTLSEAKTKGTVGPNLDQLKPSAAIVAHQVTNGGGGMPAFGKTYSQATIAEIAKFVSQYAGTGKTVPNLPKSTPTQAP